jgi:hypothetical protein
LSTDPQTILALYAQNQQDDLSLVEETQQPIAAIDELMEENLDEKKRVKARGSSAWMRATRSR